MQQRDIHAAAFFHDRKLAVFKRYGDQLMRDQCELKGLKKTRPRKMQA
jgi:hypothetical protein